MRQEKVDCPFNNIYYKQVMLKQLSKEELLLKIDKIQNEWYLYYCQEMYGEKEEFDKKMEKLSMEMVSLISGFYGREEIINELY